MSSVKRGRYVGTRRFRVRGQRTPEVNKVALIALKYFNALITAKLIASINALTLTALVYTNLPLSISWTNPNPVLLQISGVSLYFSLSVMVSLLSS